MPAGPSPRDSVFSFDVDDVVERLASELPPDIFEEDVKRARDVLMEVVRKHVWSDDQVGRIPQARVP